MPLSRFLKTFPDPDNPGFVLLYSTRKGSLVRVPASLLDCARNDSLSNTDQQTLRRLELWES